MTALWNTVAATIASPLGFVLLLPLLAIVILAVVWTARIVWWEYALVVAVPFVFVLVVQAVSVSSQTHDVEWIRLHAKEGWYEESWNRYVHRRCTTGGKRPRSYDCSYVETIPPRWWLKLSDDSRENISPKDFEALRQAWGATFVEMSRPSYTRDGDAWKASWNGDTTSLQPWTVERAWENRIHAARSVFGYSPVDTGTHRRFGLVDYPTGSGPDRPQVLGAVDPRADAILRRHNARSNSEAGPSIFLIAFEGKSPAAGRAQEALWEGGNRNEFVVCVGRKQGRTTWVHAFSWTPDKKLVIEVRDLLEERDSLTLPAMADSVAARVMPRWKMRDFHEFDYLRIQPTPRSIAFALFLSLAACLGIGWWVVHNGHTLKGEQPVRWIPRPNRPQKH